MINKKYVLIALIFFAFAIGCIVLIVTLNNKNEPASPSESYTENPPLVADFGDEDLSEKDKIIRDAKKIPVSFFDIAKPITTQDIIESDLISGIGGPELIHFYSIGTVREGDFKDAEVILVSMPFEGPSTYGAFNYFLKVSKEKSPQYYFISLNSDYEFNAPYVASGKTFKSNVSLLGDHALALSAPNEIKDKEGSLYKKVEYVNALFNGSDLTVAFTHPVLGNVYFRKQKEVVEPYVYNTGGFYVKGPGGILFVYEAMDPKKVGTLQNNESQIVLDNKNIKITSNYKYTDIGGCGSVNLVSLPNVSFDELQIVGKAKIDEGNIYTLKDPNHQILKDLYDLTSREYTETGEVRPKFSYAEFLNKFPVFFWQDKFGRLIKFQSEEFVPLAECGKPVIYLYPKETTDISVRVAPQGGFTKTIPEYGNGWNVSATPQSIITDKATGNEYPYLFWEGRGGLYETPEKGWVVSQAEIEKFINEKLTLLGLIENERKDFLEFWLPRFEGSPYYFITFLGNRDMDKIAPLEITPKPDTVIRVLMDFKPLQKKINVESFTIHTPKRIGFTAVEWGGVLR